MSKNHNSNFNIDKYNTPSTILAGAILIWLILQISLAIPDSIVDDWMGWRQADTQTIARNFLRVDSNIFYPQINWGGAGPGFVECEFQLYTFLTAQVMKISGESELPGQLLNLFFIALASIVIYLTLQLNFKNKFAALIGSIFFLISNGAVHLSTAIMPDSLCILFYSLGLFTFLKFLDDKKNSSLVLFILFSTAAALIKPLALNLGIIQFLILLIGYRQLLKSPKIWAAWIIIVGITAAYLLFSNGLYKEYGNTFGVLGGDSKFPTLKGLLVFMHYPKLVYMTIVWGLGPIGFLAGLYLIFRKKLTLIEWSLIAGNAVAILVPMRYTVNQGYSPHYYIFAALLGSWFIAKGYILLSERMVNKSYRKLIPATAVILICFFYSAHLYLRTHPFKNYYDPEVTKLGYQLKKIVEPNSLAVIRSIADERESSEWGSRINNYEDPRIFYIADVKGWAYPNDKKGYSLIKHFVDLGAKYFVEPFNRYDDEELYIWLEQNGKLVFEAEYGRIYKLNITK